MRLPEILSRMLRTWRGRLALALGLALLAGALDVGRYLAWPDVSRLAKENPRTTAFMEYRKAQWAVQGKKKEIQHNWVPLGRISPFVVSAVTISEDDRFWRHEGFDLEGMEEALKRDLARGELAAGGSTITQQLAKNLWFTPAKSPVRKLKEAVMAWRMEQALSKRRILELYLNLAEWGDGVFGIEAAARRHFATTAAGLGPEQAARLAVVLPSPLRMDPAHPSRYVERRSRVILQRMARRDPALRQEH
ncbi:MAG: monofunctional biosynthetic peptidoglycan transglycosylase [Thermodesulfobacteriota bacterium]